MKIALVYDRVNKIGGAERVLEVLHEIWPKAPLYTAVYNPQTAPWAKKFKVVPSFLNCFPFAKTKHEAYPWLTPLAFESFDLTGFDVVISVTSAGAKGIITRPETLHICYCLTPTRYLWSGYKDYFRNKIFRFLTKPIVGYLRYWDKIAAQRPDIYLAISKNVATRIKKYYGKKAEVVYPPIDTKQWKMENGKQKTEAYFLLVSRLDFGYKRVDLAIEAFNKLGLPLKIIGVGSELGRLKKMAKRNIEFLGQLTDRELLSYYQKCQALIFPQEEDFGLTPLEVQACGRPVIAYQAGGALESVIEGVSGRFFYPQTKEALVGTVKKFKPENFDSVNCRKNAIKFDKKLFKQKIKDLVEEAWQKHQNTFSY